LVFPKNKQDVNEDDLLSRGVTLLRAGPNILTPRVKLFKNLETLHLSCSSLLERFTQRLLFYFIHVYLVNAYRF